MMGAQGEKPSGEAACMGTYASETSYTNHFPQLMLWTNPTILESQANASLHYDVKYSLLTTPSESYGNFTPKGIDQLRRDGLP